MKTETSRIICIMLALLLCLGALVVYGQPAPQDTTRQRREHRREQQLRQEDTQQEDLEGRARWWQEQRTYPGITIPESARRRALEHKRQMEEGTFTGQQIKEIEEDVKGRDMWWYDQRAYPGEKIPDRARTKALEHKRRMRGGDNQYDERGEGHHSPPSPGICNWISLGPRNINGRIRSLAVHPTDGNTVYAGAAEGGIWRSSDAGQTWHPLMQYEGSIAVGSIAIDPTDPDVIYAGTGEPTWWPGYEGVGVLKSTDGGATWSSTAAMDNEHIARVVINPAHTNRVYCAGYPGGLYKSTNGGTTWSLIMAGDVTDFVLDTGSPNTMYAGVRNDGVYKSTNGGSTWTKLSGGLPATVSNRVMLTLCEASPQTLYAKLDRTVYKTTDGGTTWTDLGDHGGNTYGYWCNHVAVDPTDGDIVFAAGMRLDRSTDGGISWASAMGGSDAERDKLHVDQHALVFDPADHLRIYAANDGGVYLSTDGGTTWAKVSHGLVVTQFYDVGISWLTPSMLGGGVQDQGTNATVGCYTWHKLYGADGGFLVFHPTDRYTLYGETQYNNIIKSTNGGDSWSSARAGITGSGPWIGAIVMDDASPNTLFTGRQEVFRTTDGATTWAASSPSVGGSVLALAIAPSDHQIIYAGTNTGRVWKSTDGGSTVANWTEVTSAPLPNRAITDIAVDRSDADIVCVTFSGFEASTPATPGHVFRSTDGGATWADVSGGSGVPTGLPDIPVNAIEIDAHSTATLYVGTDIGIFRTTSTGAAWTVFEPGFPQVAVTDLELDEDSDVLFAATHGRGMWQIDIAPAATCSDVDIFIRDDLLDTGEQTPSPSGVVDPFSVVRGGAIGDRVYWWQSPDVKIDSDPFYIPDAHFDGVEFDRDLEHDSAVRTQVNHVHVQVLNRGPFTGNNVTVKILWADATAGLPALPSDFWTSYPGDPSDVSIWHPIGTHQTIPSLEPTRPEVLSWNWTPPATAATHSCILAVIDCPDDPIAAANKVLSVGWLVPNEKHVALKNLHVIDAPAAPALPPYLQVIYFHNSTRRPQRYNILIERELFPTGGGLALEFAEIKTDKPLRESILGITPADRKGCWLWRFLMKLLPFVKVPPPKLHITDDRKALITGVIVEPKEPLKAVVEVTIPAEARPGDRYRFSVIQQHEERIVGGSTYEVRVSQ